MNGVKVKTKEDLLRDDIYSALEILIARRWIRDRSMIDILQAIEEHAPDAGIWSLLERAKVLFK